MACDRPKISVATTCKNAARFVRSTLDSIMEQTLEDFEVVVVDGASDDDTVSILTGYRRVRWISEPDRSQLEGFRKAIAMARGEYILVCPISDGYLDRQWFQRCAEVLDNDREVSLVYGLHQVMSEDGKLDQIPYADLVQNPPPQKMDFFPLWLATFFPFPETIWCVRAKVIQQLFPPHATSSYSGRWTPFLRFRYLFNVSGYLPFFLPTVAGFTREHNDSLNNSKRWQQKNGRGEQDHLADIIRYRTDLLGGRVRHVFRDGDSKIIERLSSKKLEYLRRTIFGYRVLLSNVFGYQDPINLASLRAKYGMSG